MHALIECRSMIETTSLDIFRIRLADSNFRFREMLRQFECQQLDSISLNTIAILGANSDCSIR